MVATPLGIAAVVLALGVFAWVGFRTRTSGIDVEDYHLARRSQEAGTLGLSFLASGLGAWVLFATPEVGAFVGVVAVAGYALGTASPILAFGVLGERVRAVVPAGHSLTEFVRVRFGGSFHALVVVASLGYMLLFLTAELTAVGAVAAVVAGLDAPTVIVAVAATTLAYTAYGGLRASLRTDRWQAWLIVALLMVIAGALVLPGGAGEIDASAAAELLTVDRVGVEAAITLVIAVTAANLFHQGYWQRVWSAASPRALRRGAVIGGLASIPLVAVVGLLGVLAVARGSDLGDPPAPLFALVGDAPAWVGLVVLVLGVALVTSSVDTLQNGLASLVAAERPSQSLTVARVITALLLVPAVAIAVQGYSVLRLFLVADLLCAAIVVPALLGLWRRATAHGALLGALAGLAGAVAPGWLATGSLAEGAWLATFPGAVPTLGPFAGALAASTVVAVGVSLAGRQRTDLEAVADRVQPWHE